MDKTLIIFALLSALNMVATPILAFYAIHVIRKYKRAMYREGYYQGFIERLPEMTTTRKKAECGRTVFIARRVRGMNSITINAPTHVRSMRGVKSNDAD